MENNTILTISNQTSALEVWKKATLTISLSLIIFIALIGNMVIVVVFCTHRPLRKFINSFIVSLAVSDIVIGAVGMPIWIVGTVWRIANNKLIRDAWIYLDIVAGVSSILNLTAVSVCRYIQITKPYNYTKITTKTRIIFSLIAIWIFGGIMALLKGLTPQNTNHWYYQPGYQLLVFFCSFAMPLAAISYCYFHIFKEVTRQQNNVPKAQSPQQHNHNISIDIKAIKTIAIVVVIFVICWCPFFVVVLVNGFCKCVENTHLIILAKVMHYSNSALNPIIYVWHNAQYRKAFIKSLVKFANYHGAEFVVAFLNDNAKRRKSRARETKQEFSAKILTQNSS